MSCPDIYIAPSYWTTPHAAEYGNTAIDVGPGGTSFTQGVTRGLQVTVRNHGTDDSPDSRLQLYWANPGTGFTLMGQIDVDKFVVVPGGDGFAFDGSVVENFSFTPDASVVATNGGHVCLLARVKNESSPGLPCLAQGYTTPAATDARSAIRNIHVYAPPPSPHKHHIPPGGKGNGMNFAFAAADPQANMDESRLEIRALDPVRDKERLQHLVADQGVFQALANRHGKFALPEAVLVGEGVERVVLPRPAMTVRHQSDALLSLPRIGQLGPMSNDTASRLLVPGTKLTETKKPLSMKLVPGEMRQIIVQVIPHSSQTFHAVAVDHKGPKDRPIGGLTMIFVPPPELY